MSNSEAKFLNSTARFILKWPILISEEIGNLVILAGQVIFWTFKPPFRFRVMLESLYYVGVGTIFIVMLVASFTGAVFSLQSIIGLSMFRAESMVGGLVGLGFTREMAPVFTALLLAARAGSAMATELGTMRVTDQIDALATMGINPVQYLIVPRVLSSTLMAPLLCMVFNIVGIAGSWVICIVFEGLDPGVFLDTIMYWVDPKDIFQGLIKVVVLGFLVSLIACQKGYYARGGAAGVGNATTKAVVNGFVTIFVVDYFLTAIMNT